MRLTALYLRRVLAATWIVLLTSTLAFGQSGVASADLSGVVTDPQGAVVPSASVTLRNVNTNIERTVTTNSEGRYTFSAVPPADYELSVTAQGFKKLQTSGLTLTVGQSAELDLSLEVALSGGDNEVTIVAGAELIETTRTSVATTIDRNRIENLPINGRNFLNFTLTSSTIVRDNSPSIGPAPTAGLNAGGQRARSNNVSIDGADNNDNSVNGVRGTVSQEAVQEFQLITNSYAPEFGRASGAVVNIITKSGSNDFHGNVFGFLRHRSFQARNAFSISDDPSFTRGQYGGTLGGPIVKDKTFFFAAFEQTRRQETAFSIIGRDPSIFNLTGDQIGFATNANVFDSFGLTSDFLATLGLNQAALTPLSPALTLLRGNSETGLVGAYGLTSAIARLGFNPVNGARFFPSGAPIPTTYVPLGGFDPSTGFPLNGEFPISEKTTQFSIRVDHQFNTNNNFSFRYNVVPSEATGLQSNAQNQVFGQNAFSRTARTNFTDNTVVASNITTFGDGAYINEFRFQFANRDLRFLPECGDPNEDCANFNASSVAVNINGLGFFGREPFAPVIRTERRYQFSDNFSILKSNHNFKFGADFNYLPLDAIFELNFGGLFNFGELPGSVFFQPGTAANGALTQIVTGLAASLIGNGVPPEQAAAIAGAVGNRIVASAPSLTSVQAYGLGVPQNFIQGFNDPTSNFSNTQISFFGQDSWRIRPNLTFNYGVRYDFELPPTFEPQASCPTCGAAEAALGVQQGFPRDYNNVQPRVALAWDPWGDGKTVIRAAYGLFYDHPLLAAAFNSNVADGAQAPQLILDPSNAARVFQGIPIAGIPSGSQLLNQQRFDPSKYPGDFSPLLPFTLPIDKTFEYGYSQQANFTVEREVFEDFSLSASYLFVRGLHLNRPRDINTPILSLLLRNRDRAVAAGLVPPGTNPQTVAAFRPDLGVVPAALFNFFRPSGPNFALGSTLGLSQQQLVGIAQSLGLPTGPGTFVPFSSVVVQESTGKSDYHGLTVNLNKRFSHHYQFVASYTWSHAIDDSTDLQTLLAPQDNNRLDLERGNSYFDQRHRFVLSGVFVSPYQWKDDGFMKKFLADFTFAPIVEFAAGRPFNVHTGVDTNLDVSSQTDRPNLLLPGQTAPAGVDVFTSDFGSFFLPSEGQAGTLGRTTGVRPGYASVDVRVTRRITLTEVLRLELIGEVFNLFNRTNISDVNNNFKVAGVPTAASDPRQFQFGIKLSF